MTDDRRMTADRFYGGVTDRVSNLRSMLAFIRNEQPTRDRLTEWVISNTRANSADAISHHLTFLDSIDLIHLSDSACTLDDYGRQWLDDQDEQTLYAALSTGVKGFDTILEALQDRPMTDDDIMDLLVSEFEEAEMTKPGPAIRHREWLQVLGLVDREDGINRLTQDGHVILAGDKAGLSSPVSMHTPPEGISVDDRLTQEEIEAAFDTGFGYRISGINPRRDEQDRQYVLLFANEDGPYDDAVTHGRFEYIGEGLSGDQSESSPGNSVLIDAISEPIPVHFFYQRSGGGEWEYQGLVEVLDYETREQDGREVLEFTMKHKTDRRQVEDQTPLQEENDRLEQALSTEPQLTENEEEFTAARRRAREQAFAHLVNEAYDQTCAICGARRESPQGDPEVEAAHIYPKRKGGADDVRNGLALCRLHHWAFDNGWLSVSDDYEILVKEAPEREGYYEFKQLEGDTLHLPKNPKAEPHPTFLEEHRNLHGFQF